MHMNAVWQNLYMCTTKSVCALLTFTENCAPLVWLQDFNIIYFLQFHSLMPPNVMPGTISSFSTPLRILSYNILLSFIAALKACTIQRTACTANARLPSNCDAHREWERSRKVRNPDYLKALSRNRESNRMRTLLFLPRLNQIFKYERWLLETETLLGNVTKVHWWSWWDFATG